ncbi:MAG TPA: tRNA uridine-5-carboxymethylaminomethyl(34) synthesis enzyme MnmG [Phycisphaerae bacterium]|nr:tRNA uridine-5-carboxymethylaminomethyl(34) synthesis enzyme MnmG [Phycisphaerae bacterium]
MGSDTRYDVVVIGGGHAGAEAAHAAAVLGARTALITMDARAIARMSCNPAIGGLGKGQMVREIDALGGLMGRAIDATGIQFRTLNTSKGPAVRAPRAQADREGYAAWIAGALRQTPGLEIIEGTVADVLTSKRTGSPARGVTCVALDDGRVIACGAVIVTTGTFLRGLMHCGERQTEGGRVGEAASLGMSGSLQRLGLKLGRLKTGTPPRVHRDSIDYELLTPQPGDADPRPFSFVTREIERRQVECWIGYTNERSHRLIRENLHRAPLYTGQIQSTGPRYCPSIEDKVVRFADKPRHQLFLEPEGYDDDRVYCNGISTSLPVDVQEELVHSVAGLGRARILQHGYAVEYDFVPTHQIQASLAVKCVAGLFLAGQINGTSGYEEAAGQGLVAGVNAVRHLDGRGPLVLGRDQAYIGVMIDDLVTRPPSEPYRMFTSRAEYRLHLRADNADQRLTPIGREYGLVSDDRWELFVEKRRQIDQIRQAVGRLHHDGVPLARWLRRPESRPSDLAAALEGQGQAGLGEAAIEQIHVELRYGGYLARQEQQIERFRKLESLPIPEHLNYGEMPELRLEAREKLASVAPRTLGQASRISGINPADLTVLWVYVSGRRSSASVP